MKRPAERRRGERRKLPNKLSHPLRLGKARLDELVEEATVDCYDEAEQASRLLTKLEDHLALPFETEVLGVKVTVERLDATLRGEIVAICARGRERQTVPLLDLRLPSPPPAGFEWVEAYRRWSRGR